MARNKSFPSGLLRPRPPAECLQDESPIFKPSTELRDWLFEAFISGHHVTLNPDHEHLQSARLACLWTNVPQWRGAGRIGGTAEMPSIQGGLWKKLRFEQHLVEWFGYIPDFIITIDAEIANRINDVSFCCLTEHELYHCGQAVYKSGEPKFTKDGDPVFALRSHDVEEFVAMPARYGIEACAGKSEAFVRAAMKAPMFGAVDLQCVCGSCGR